MDWTSHDAVAFVRSRLKVKAGHAGTLDPKATGLLLILVNDATKQSGSLTGLDKDYCGTFELGKTTDTQDLEGAVTRTASYEGICLGDVDQAMKDVASRGLQTPPVFSALKRGGKSIKYFHCLNFYRYLKIKFAFNQL